jgi:hypothetical protein
MDIVPIQLSLTAGDLITLWAPMWREDGEEWEGFLGDDAGVHAFPDASMLTAYVRTVAEHDLRHHPAWPLVPQLTAPELVPTEDQCYDVVGVPEIVADEPDTWMIGELAGITSIVRSLADACGLDNVHDVLDSADGFAVLDRGTFVFTGREGRKLWEQLADTVAARWDEVIDALDGAVTVPEVDPAEVAAARKEFSLAVTGRHAMRSSARADPTRHASSSDADPAADSDPAQGSDSGTESATSAGIGASAGSGPESSPNSNTEAAAFWEEVGIDPILISTDEGDHYTLRCYLDDRPLFLGTNGRIRALPSARALAQALAENEYADGHDLARASTWPEVVDRAVAGTLVVEVDPQNVYQLGGLGQDLADGPTEVDPNQLDLGVELLTDVGEWAGDDAASVALAPSQSLGWLTSFVLRPDPTRLAPSPPFDSEAARWNDLVANLVGRLSR